MFEELHNGSIRQIQEALMKLDMSIEQWAIQEQLAEKWNEENYSNLSASHEILYDLQNAVNVIGESVQKFLASFAESPEYW
jgi:hypothetical protein